MATSPRLVEIPLTLRVSQEAKARLDRRASESGTELAEYVSTIVEQVASGPLSLEEISGPVYQRFVESGMSDDELSDLLEKEKHEARIANRARQAS